MTNKKNATQVFDMKVAREEKLGSSYAQFFLYFKPQNYSCFLLSFA